MSLVSREAIQHLESLRGKARECSSWEASYQWAMRGLEAAIAQLKQIDAVTQNVTVIVKTEG